MQSTYAVETPHKLLLTSVCRPFGGKGEGESVRAELFQAQVTRAQGPFGMRQTVRVWALDYLAANVKARAVTLHYPSRRELVKELRQGGYTHVGINFVVSTFHKVRQMVPWIRKHAPRAKIILGGYGTVLSDEILRPWADAICREEGTGFLRRLLGEDPNAPLVHPHAPITAPQVLAYQLPTVVGHVTAGLGCPNGCDFCCTSHFFKRKYVRYLETGRDIYEALLATRRKCQEDGQKLDSYILIDEDFFLHHRRAKQFLDCVREAGDPLSIMGFGSVRGISRFSAREIAEMGFDILWNGFEGADAGYRKQQGKSMAELYRSLQSVGCSPLTSMIIGFPYQDRAQILREFEALMALEPAMVQCLIPFALPGTPLHDRIIAEDQYLPEFRDAPDLRKVDGFSMLFRHPKFQSPTEVEALQRHIYAEDYRRLGPTLLRMGRIWLTGYENLRNDSNPLLAARAERLREFARSILPVTRVGMIFAPSKEVYRRAERLRVDLIRLTGEPTRRELALEMGSSLSYLLVRAVRRMGILQQPGLLRTEHRTPREKDSLHTRHVRRLQGGIFSGLRTALVDDALDKAEAIAMRWFPGRQAAPAALRLVTTRATQMPPSLPVLPGSPRPSTRSLHT